ncbi:hypothetical protein FR932_19925 [Moritella marina ATCC 15381]|uniref:Uncharacterized protein n=1 Tax=Moritella marina ATCC 15381 TaxID=1202962 RepID=A0A5J6WSX9_MORMI|nr:E2/UBC family protein [Moritella marina]QFI39920.1 hypothetical protein FR932_19925 [Moritella marina ATCC 15381]
MNQELHRILLRSGFRYTPAKQMPDKILLDTQDRRKGYYVKEYSTHGGVFSIALILQNDPYVQLPFAYILQIPDQYKGRLLPHINFGCFLCYVTQMEADWNSNNLDDTYCDVDKQIQLTLNNAVASAERGDPNDRELEGEFSAYWQSEDNLYLLTRPTKKASLTTMLAESELSNGNTYREYISVTSTQKKEREELAKWLIQRGFNERSLKEQSISTHYISVRPTRLAGLNWPPKNIREVLIWLKQVDHSARDHVANSLISKQLKRHLLLFDVEGQDELAIYLELNAAAVSYRRHSKNASKKSSMQHLIAKLSGKQACNQFKRLSVIRADRDTLLSRNLPRPNIGNLSKKRIALIGCGTIGSYIAGLLLRSGAGCGDKYWHLYDNDTFSPHNFARNALTAHDFGKYKATALAENLMQSVHIANNIKGIDTQFPIKSNILEKYDVIIDATGRPPVSKRLAAVVRTVQPEKRPVIIHAFNDGNGRASKVLVDNGDCCYGCMTSDPANYRNGIDLRFTNIDQEKERKISCGSTYTPYDAAVSHITAALAQEAALNTLEQVLPWNYSEHMLDGSRSKKPRILKHNSNCSICNE